MAGRGPAPKPTARRARTNRDPIRSRVLVVQSSPQPDLPLWEVERDGELLLREWPTQTRRWWASWGSSPWAASFTEPDWSSLLDTAVVHAAFWEGNIKLAGELRRRVGKFGATADDRARLWAEFASTETSTGGPA